MSHDLFLMVDPVGDQIFPVSQRAFAVATAPISRVLARNCVALFLGRDGKVWRIDRIKLHRGNPLRRLGLWFGVPAAAKFEMAEVDTSVEDIKTIVLNSVHYSRQRGVEPDDWWLLTAPLAEVESAISHAQSLEELYSAIKFPLDQDCLDLL